MTRTLIPLVGFLLLCLGSNMAGGTKRYMKYKDPKVPIEDRVQDLLSMIPLKKRLVKWFSSSAKICSLLSGGGSVPAKHATPQQWMDMVNEFQKGSLATRLGIPYIYDIDAVHGHNNVYKATIFPHNVGLGVTRDPDLVKRIGAATALEVRATGIPYAFAPCIAVCRDPRWGRCYESYSQDPSIIRMMTELIPGLQGYVSQNHHKGVPYVGGKDKVAACSKPYVGDGVTVGGINENNNIVSSHDLYNIHMPAYYDSLDKGVSAVMASYSSSNGTKMHANYDMVTGFLKSKVEFQVTNHVSSCFLGMSN